MVVVACRIIVSAPVPFPFLWTLDLGFGTWIWDLDLVLDLGLTIFICLQLSCYLNNELMKYGEEQGEQKRDNI